MAIIGALTLDNGIAIYTVDLDPTIETFESAAGSIAILENSNKIFIKGTGSISDWTLFGLITDVDSVVNDASFAAPWLGVTDIAPSKNAVYNEMILKLNLSGGVMTGDINMNSNNILNLGSINGVSSGVNHEIVPYKSTGTFGPGWNNIRTYVIGGGTYDNPDLHSGLYFSPSQYSSIIYQASGSQITTMTQTLNGFVFSLGSTSAGGLGVSTNAGSYVSNFRNDTVTADRTYQLPDASGTLPLLSLAQTFTAVNTFSNSSGTNIYKLNLRNHLNTAYQPALSYTSNGATNALEIGGGSVLTFVGNAYLKDDTTSNYRQLWTTQGTNTLSFGGGFASTNIQSSGTVSMSWPSYSLIGTGSNLAFVGVTPVIRSSNAGTPITLMSATVGVAGSPSGNLLLTTGTQTGGGNGLTGNVCIYVGLKGSGTAEGNVQINAGGTTVSANGMQSGIFIGNATSVPTANPTAGLYMYSNTGDFNIWTSSGGKITLGVTSSLGNLNILDQDGTTQRRAMDSNVTNTLRIGAGFLGVNIPSGLTIGQLFPNTVYTNSYMGASSGGTMTIGPFDPNGGVLIGTIGTLTTRAVITTQTPVAMITVDNTGAGGIGGITIRTGNHNNAVATTINSIDIYTGNILNAATVAKTGDLRFDVGTVGAAGTRGGIAFFNGQTSPTWQGLQRGFFEGNMTTAPTDNPSNGLFRWTEFGNFKIRTSSGTVITLGGVSDFNDIRILDQDGVTQRVFADSVTTNIARIANGFGTTYITSASGLGVTSKYMLLDSTYKSALNLVSTGILGVGNDFNEISLLKPITQFKSISGYNKFIEADLAGNPVAVEEIIPLKIFNIYAQNVLGLNTNWDSDNTYIGSSLSSYNLNQGQYHQDSLYYYWMDSTTIPIRIPRHRVIRRLYNTYNVVLNSGSTETNLLSYNIIANTLNKNSDSVSIDITGQIASAAINPTFNIKLGSTPTVIFTRIWTSPAAYINFKINIKIVRTSSNNQRIFITYISDETGVTDIVSFTDTTITDTSDINLLITGQDTTSNKVALVYTEIEFNPSV